MLVQGSVHAFQIHVPSLFHGDENLQTKNPLFILYIFHKLQHLIRTASDLLIQVVFSFKWIAIVTNQFPLLERY